MKDFSYQERLIDQTYRHIIKDKICLLAACPGAGKTNMALRIAQRYLADYPKAKILVLTHGQKILRIQFYQRAISLGISCIQELKEREYKVNQPIVVTLPQAMIKKVHLYKFDFLIIDEAHHFYNGEMVQNIIKSLKFKHQLLLTGTPSDFIGKVPIVSITLSELINKKILIDPSIRMIATGIQLNEADYHRNFELKADKILKSDVMKIVRHLDLDPTSKTMIICHSKENAIDIHEYLLSREYKATLSISGKGIYRSSGDFEEFKENTNFLIVVKRGILGFDYSQLCTVIDLTMSLNINRMFQQVCRVVRNSSDKKIYVKVFPETMREKNMLAIYSVISMAYPETYLRAHVKRDIPYPSERSGMAQKAELSFGDFEFYIEDAVSLSFSRDWIIGYTAGEVLEIMGRFESYFEFKKADRRAYRFAIRTFPEIVRERFPDSPKPIKIWDVFLAKSEMVKYKERTKFKVGCLGAYKFLLKNGREMFESHFSKFKHPNMKPDHLLKRKRRNYV